MFGESVNRPDKRYRTVTVTKTRTRGYGTDKSCGIGSTRKLTYS